MSELQPFDGRVTLWQIERGEIRPVVGWLTGSGWAQVLNKRHKTFRARVHTNKHASGEYRPVFLHWEDARQHLMDLCLISGLEHKRQLDRVRARYKEIRALRAPEGAT